MLSAQRSIIGFKVETTAGTAEDITATECAYNVFNASRIQPQFPYYYREGQGTWSPLPGVAGPAIGTISFDMELYNAATWGAVLLPACGLKNASNVFTVCSEEPGTNVKTITIQEQIIDTAGTVNQYKLCGCSGNVVFNFVNGQITSASFTFTGKYVAPTGQSAVDPSYPDVTPILCEDLTLTIGSLYGASSVNMVASSISFDLGNQVVPREDLTAADGHQYMRIADRLCTGTIDPESVLVGTDDIWADIIANTQSALALTAGATGSTITISCPKVQISRQQLGNRNEAVTDELTFVSNRVLGTGADAGDDEFVLDLEP